MMIVSQSNITLRRGTIEDAATLVALAVRTFRETYGTVAADKDLAYYISHAFSLEQLSSELANPQISIFLAEVDKQLCGWVKLQPTPVPDAITGRLPIELSRLYVTSEWIGKGMGSKLVQMALEYAIARGYQSCWLRVWEGNPRAIAFYRRWGFIEVGSEPYAVGEASGTVLLMTRQLIPR